MFVQRQQKRVSELMFLLNFLPRSPPPARRAYHKVLPRKGKYTPFNGEIGECNWTEGEAVSHNLQRQGKDAFFSCL